MAYVRIRTLGRGESRLDVKEHPQAREGAPVCNRWTIAITDQAFEFGDGLFGRWYEIGEKLSALLEKERHPTHDVAIFEVVKEREAWRAIVRKESARELVARGSTQALDDAVDMKAARSGAPKTGAIKSVYEGLGDAPVRRVGAEDVAADDRKAGGGRRRVGCGEGRAER